MLLTVISFLVYLTPAAFLQAEAPSVCQQLAHFSRLQAATLAKRTLHVLIRNPPPNNATSAYHQLALNEATVDNIRGRLKVWTGQTSEKQVQAARDVPWLRWLSFWEQDNPSQQLIGHLQYAMLDTSRPSAGSLAIVDGRQYCSASVEEEASTTIRCSPASGERVVGSIGSVDYGEQTQPMLIFVEETVSGQRVLKMRKLKDKSLRTEAIDSKRRRDVPLSAFPSQTHLFGFIFAGTVHLWHLSNSSQPWVCLFADPREKMAEVDEPMRLQCSLMVAASEYFQCPSSSSSSFTSQPSPILSQKSALFAATLGVLLLVVAIVGISLLARRRTRLRGRGEIDDGQRSTNASTSELELTRNKMTMSNAFQGNNAKSVSLRQAGGIGSSSSTSATEESQRKQTRTANMGKQWKLKDHHRRLKR